MFPRTIKMLIETLFLFILVTYAKGQDRQLASVINPGCNDCDRNRNPLVYIRARGTKDTIHQLWDFTEHVPGVAYLVGSANSTLNVVWKGTHPSKFEFSDPASSSYSFAAAIDSIIEYNDIHDNGQYDANSTIKPRIWPLDRTWWTLTDSVLVDNKEAMVMVRGEQDGKKGVIEMKLDVLPFKDYAVELPHLIHTANSTLVDVRLVNYTDSRQFNSSRFALRLVLASTDAATGSWATDMRKSLDDEHTPGVFEILEVRSQRLVSAGAGGFVQFRPVAYTEPERAVSSSTIAHITRIDNSSRASLPPLGVLRALYRDYFRGAPATLVTQQAVVSFGLAGDGFYRQHNFTSWSFTIGYGTPPLESFSLFVLIIISIGLGVPILLTLAGVVYVVVRRCRTRNPPARFTNDE